MEEGNVAGLARMRPALWAVSVLISAAVFRSPGLTSWALIEFNGLSVQRHAALRRFPTDGSK
jgi:hypothetical protein